LDQQAAKARAINEQFTLDEVSGVEQDRSDIARLAVAANLGDSGVDPAHAARLAEAPEEPGEGRSIEMHGPIKHVKISAGRLGRFGKAPGPRHLRSQ